jgi:hypothetical protein
METLGSEITTQRKDVFEDFIKELPGNLHYIHNRGTRSYFETLVRFEPNSDLTLFDHYFAKYGEQISDELFELALKDAMEASRHYAEVTHVRCDFAGLVEENGMNAPYRYVEGHSWHKIAPEDKENYIEVDGKLYYKPDLI